MLRFLDRAIIGGTRITKDGYLVADVKTARTGIQSYAGWEVGRPDLPSVAVYRDEAQVFDVGSLSTYAHKPVTNNHPSEDVTASNWKDHAVGFVGGDVARDGDYVRVPLVVMDAAAIADVQAGKRELSAGYECVLEWKDGVAPDGSVYQAIQKDIRINHVAIVAQGRAGSQARIGDGAPDWGFTPDNSTKERKIPMSDALKKILVDGLQVEVTDAGAVAIEKLIKKLGDAETAHSAALAAKDTILAAKDAELAAKDAKIADLESKALTDAQLDAMLTQRVSFHADVKAVVPDFDVSGKSTAEIKRAVCEKVRGADAVANKTDAYIEAAFDILVADAKEKEDKGDAFRDTMRQQQQSGGGKMMDHGQADYEKRLTSAWKGA